MLQTKIYRNPVSKSNQYLNYLSCHPLSTKNSIPYSLALRVFRNCSSSQHQEATLVELFEALVINSSYPPEIVTEGFNAARLIPREELLKKKPPPDPNNSENGRIVMVTPFNQSLLPITKIICKTTDEFKGIDSTFDNIFQQTPLVAWSRGPTLKSAFSPSQLPSDQPKRWGHHHCDYKSCVPCKDAIFSRTVTINSKKRNIIGEIDCNTAWVVYALHCTICKLWYVGKTYTPLKVRWSSHKSKIKKCIGDFAAGRMNFNADSFGRTDEFRLWEHFAVCHGSLASLKYIALHHVGKRTKDPAGNLLKWEHEYISHFGTLWPSGLNKNK